MKQIKSASSCFLKSPSRRLEKNQTSVSFELTPVKIKILFELYGFITDYLFLYFYCKRFISNQEKMHLVYP
jgi:hypothetical protein